MDIGLHVKYPLLLPGFNEILIYIYIYVYICIYIYIYIFKK